MALTKIPGHGVNINATGNGQVQFNDAGILDGSANLTFNQVTNTLFATNFSGNGSLLTGIVAPPSATAGTVTTNAQPNITSVGTLSSVNVSGTATLTNVGLSGNIIPTLSNTYSLGSETFNFKDVYIGPGSLYINGSKVLEEVSNTIIFTADLNQSVRLATSGTGDIQLLPSGTGVISIQGPLQILAGENITSSNGTKIGFSNPIGVDAITTLSANTELVITGNGTGNVKVDDDLIITGNLTLQGTTGNLSVTNLTVQDNIIDISAETTGVPTSNAGIRVIRGDESATLLRWTESLTSWQFTNDGTNYLSMVGRDSVGNTSLGNIALANFFVGNGSQLTGVTVSSIAGANVTGTVANATYAISAGTVTTNAQPNITSVGTLSSIAVTGNITSGNASLGNAASANYFVGNGSLLTGIATVSSSIINGNSNVVVSANSNVTMSVAGVANVVVVSTDGITVAGNISANTITTSGGSGNISGANVIAGVTLIATGNITSGNAALGNAASANYFVGNGSLLTGISTTSTTIFNGNSNVVVSANSNVTMSVAGVANVVVVSTDGITVAGNISANTITTSGGSGNITGANVIAGVTLSASGQLTSTIVTGTAPLSVLSTTLVPNLFVANATYATSAGSATTAATANAVAGANVSGTVANATYAVSAGSATTAGTVTTAAQPNITSVGTLTSLSVSGNILPTANVAYDLGSATNRFRDLYLSGNTLILGDTSISVSNGNISLGNFVVDTTSGTIVGADIVGDVSGANHANIADLANSVAGANVSGTVANATYAVTSGSSTTAATITTNAQPNITSVGTLTELTVTGNVTLSGANVSLGSVGNLHIAGGTSAYVLSTDGAGNLSWIAQSGSGGGGGTASYDTRMYTGNGVQNTFAVTTGVTVDSLIVTENGVVQTPTTDYTVSGSNLIFVNPPDADVVVQVRELSGAQAFVAGTNTQVQFNNAGNFGASAGLTFNSSTTALVANNLIATSTANLGAVGNVTITGGTANYVLSTDGTGNLSWVEQTGGVGASTFTMLLNTFIGTGAQTSFTLSSIPTSSVYTSVNIGGVMQFHSAYTLSGAVITFSAPPFNGVKIEIIVFKG